uniref:uncharacterized protein n=1 Tax=Myxine glutinosa TaxID=7769 RepID=UPI00358EA436
MQRNDPTSDALQHHQQQRDHRSQATPMCFPPQSGEVLDQDLRSHGVTSQSHHFEPWLGAEGALGFSPRLPIVPPYSGPQLEEVARTSVPFNIPSTTMPMPPNYLPQHCIWGQPRLLVPDVLAEPRSHLGFHQPVRPRNQTGFVRTFGSGYHTLHGGGTRPVNNPGNYGPAEMRPELRTFEQLASSCNMKFAPVGAQNESQLIGPCIGSVAAPRGGIANVPACPVANNYLEQRLMNPGPPAPGGPMVYGENFFPPYHSRAGSELVSNENQFWSNGKLELGGLMGQDVMNEGPIFRTCVPQSGLAGDAKPLQEQSLASAYQTFGEHTFTGFVEHPMATMEQCPLPQWLLHKNKVVGSRGRRNRGGVKVWEAKVAVLKALDALQQLWKAVDDVCAVYGGVPFSCECKKCGATGRGNGYSEAVQALHDQMEKEEVETGGCPHRESRIDVQWHNRFVGDQGGDGGVVVMDEKRSDFQDWSFYSRHASEAREMLQKAMIDLKAMGVVWKEVEQETTNENEEGAMSSSCGKGVEQRKVVGVTWCAVQARLHRVAMRRERQKRAKQSVRALIEKKGMTKGMADTWLEEEMRKVEAERMAQEVKGALAGSFAAVRRKCSTLSRARDLLSAMERLRKLRMGMHSHKGVSLSGEVEEAFIKELERLRGITKRRLVLYAREELTLKVMAGMDTDSVERGKRGRINRPNKASSSSADDECHRLIKAWSSLEALVHVRREWDNFLVPEDCPGCRIPQGWVTSCAPSSAIWASALST